MCALGEAIFHAWRDFGEDLPLDEAVGLEGAESEDKHFLGDVGELGRELLEAQRVVTVEGVKDEECPFVADTVEDVAYRAIGIKFVFIEIPFHVGLDFILVLYW